jgi:predicted transcriptional regulator
LIVNRNAYPFFSALASKTRLQIIELLGTQPMNIKELAAELNLSSAIVAKHVKILEKGGIIKCKNMPGARGLQKKSSLIHEGFALNFEQERDLSTINVIDLPIGQYTDWQVQPTCGLVTRQSYLGYQDDVRCFADPNRCNVGCLWLGHGYLEYVVPNYLNGSQKLSEIRIQMEICSEAPGYDAVWPSDIFYSLNGVELGFWTCPGDFGDKPGLYSPAWYAKGNCTQYGQLKQITVNQQGSFIDGIRMSDIKLSDLNIDRQQIFRFRISSPEDAENPRGFTLFGKGFGNYDQNIIFTMISDKKEKQK